MTVNVTGRYDLSYGLSGLNRAAGRAGLEARVQIDTGAGFGTIPQSHKGGYARFNTIQQFADATLPPYERAFTADDELKLQIQHTTNAFDVEGHLHLKRVS